MASHNVRQVERSYISLLLEKDPDYYARNAPNNQTEYDFSDLGGRKFKSREPYALGPYTYHYEYEGELVTYNGELVTLLSDVIL